MTELRSLRHFPADEWVERRNTALIVTSPTLVHALATVTLLISKPACDCHPTPVATGWVDTLLLDVFWFLFFVFNKISTLSHYGSLFYILMHEGNSASWPTWIQLRHLWKRSGEQRSPLTALQAWYPCRGSDSRWEGNWRGEHRSHPSTLVTRKSLLGTFWSVAVESVAVKSAWTSILHYASVAAIYELWKYWYMHIYGGNSFSLSWN